MLRRRLAVSFAIVSAAVLLTATGVASASIDNPAMTVTGIPEHYPGSALTVSGDGCGGFDGPTNYAQSQQVTVELYPAADDQGDPLASKTVEVPESGEWSLELTIPADAAPGEYSVEAICIVNWETSNTATANRANALPGPTGSQSSVNYQKINIAVVPAQQVSTTTTTPGTTAPPTTGPATTAAPSSRPTPAGPARAVTARPTYTG